MAEYIEKQKLLNDTKIRQSDNGLVRTRKFLFRNYIKSLPTAGVVERAKVDKAIEEMERYSTSFEYANRHDLASAVDCCIGMIQKNIGEKENESND